MGTFKKSTNISGKFKFLTANGGQFVDKETGEAIAVADMIEQAMGDKPFDLTVSAKEEEDID